jgi:hypothetical protein
METQSSNLESAYEVGMGLSKGIPEDDREFKVAVMMVRGLVDAGIPMEKAWDAVMGKGFYQTMFG